jgi:hypothetical protein
MPVIQPAEVTPSTVLQPLGGGRVHERGRNPQRQHAGRNRRTILPSAAERTRPIRAAPATLTSSTSDNALPKEQIGKRKSDQSW